MKRILFLFILVFSYMLCGAQATSLTIDNKIAGTLSERILYDDKLTVENLKITGMINADDLAFIQELNSKFSLTGIIDMSEATITQGGRCLVGNQYISSTGNSLNVGIFNTYNRLKKLIAPRSLKSWNDGSYLNNNGSAGYSRLYPNLNTDSLIIECENLTEVGNGIGNPSYIFFGEGIKSVQLASKYMDRVPGASDDFYLRARDTMSISLPSTLTSIYGNKQMRSPFMRIYSKILRPDQLQTNSTGWYNTVFTKGVIHAPNDTKEFYENSIFKNLEIIAPISIKKISLNIHSLTLKTNEKYSFFASIEPSNAENKDIIWKSSNDNVITVNEVGEITALKGGNATITVSSVNNPIINDECDIIVIQPVAGISLSKQSIEMIEDDSMLLIATVIPNDASNKSVKWSSSDISVAMVSNEGRVYALKPGQATIMATTVDGGYVALCKVIVKTKTILAESLAISTTNYDMTVGETFQLKAIVLPENTTNKNVRWSSTNIEIATINENGIVTALKEGKTQIIASTMDGSNLSAICELYIANKFIYISQITVSPNTLKLEIGETTNLNVNIIPTDATNKSINWSSTNANVASISSDGLITANRIGNATIIASTQDGSNLSATCYIEVCKDAGIDNIIIDKDTVVKIYSIQGALIYEGEYSNSNLDSGIYILKTKKQIIKKIIM